ncbi:FecR family protein [Pedobacter psychroterrae]|uniref:FecR family protein n=1 Tax=Pedobacter psychroterrae TaxID=2530453 RepID=A0A4R0NP83_9SPHI|nr:FecR family protein [Pedobacter psychroterrae]TCD02731.1 FecR family protein [Pedobacter psychroterrae]
MTNEEAKELIAKYNAGQCTDSEKALIEDWYMQLSNHEHDLSDKRIEEIGQEILQQLPKPDPEERIAPSREEADSNPPRIENPKTVKLIKVISGIAAVLLLWYGNYMYITANRTPTNQETTSIIQPGSNRATLTLSNGKKINLSDAKTGVIIDVNELTYNDGTPIENPGETIGTQTLSTPKGGQYQVVFKDGTKIWLNAASTLTFKTSPSYLATREVSLSGEAYFEIAKDKNRPFKVLTSGQVIEVLGTHFNVSAYKDDVTTKTTLVEGSVSVNQNIILSPGEQANLTGSKITVQKIDTDNAVAWKNGEFMFLKEKLRDIMPKLSRWYDVEIAYQNEDLANRQFSGTISKFENVAEVLRMLQLTGEINFKIEGRRILVMP